MTNILQKKPISKQPSKIIFEDNRLRKNTTVITYNQGSLFPDLVPIILNTLPRVTKGTETRTEQDLQKDVFEAWKDHPEENLPDSVVDDNIELCPSERSGYVNYECEDCGSVVVKQIGCNKEYCPVCGKKWGVVHQRRYFRGVNKIEYMYSLNKTLGYWVITFPDSYRDKLDRAKIGKFHNYIKRYFKEKYDYGLCMWHWCGEDGETYHPHMNVLLPSGFLVEDELKKIKTDIRKQINKMVDGDKDNIVLNYGYTKKFKKAMHYWRYVCRPTWRVYSEQINEIAFNYRNQRFWGDFNNKMEQNDFEKVEKMICPMCGGQLRVCEDFRFERTLNKDYHIHLGGGIYLYRKYRDKTRGSPFDLN